MAGMWQPGRSTIDELLARRRLDMVSLDRPAQTIGALLERARLRINTARAARDGGDLDGAYAAAYDAYRMAAETLLAIQGLRATSGAGSHVAVEDAVAAQFDSVIETFAKPTFERLRRTRHSAQYFDPSSPEITANDVDWAIETSASTVDATSELIDRNPPRVYLPD